MAATRGCNNLSVAISIAIIAGSFCFFGMNIRLCVISAITGLQSQCVYCNSLRYPQTIITCTGKVILPVNITQGQAVCLLDTCIQERNGLFYPLGKKRRDVEDGATAGTENTEKVLREEEVLVLQEDDNDY